MAFFNIIDNIGQINQKKIPGQRQHKRAPSTKFFDVVKETYSSHKIKDSVLVNVPTASRTCDACGNDPACLAVKHPELVSVQNGLAPLLTFMKYLGLLHETHNGKKITLSCIYPALISLTLWINFARFFGVYSENVAYGTKLFFKITLHVWYGQAALVCTLYLLSISPDLPKLFKAWDKFVFKLNCRTAMYIRRVTMKGIIAGCILVFGITIINLSAVLVEDDPKWLSISTFVPFNQGNPTPMSLRCIYVIFNAHLALVWMLPTVLLCTICLGIKKNFSQVVQQLTDDLHDHREDHSIHSLEAFRIRHQKLCRLTKQTDLIFSLYNMTIYMTCIPLLCFVIYNFAFHAYDGHMLTTLLSVTQLLIILLQMSIITAAASALTMEATKPTEELFEISLEGSNHETFQKAVRVMIFLQRVTHCHIGLTAWNLFNINKQTILTVTTMILSYVFVLIKFGLTLEKDALQLSKECKNNTSL